MLMSSTRSLLHAAAQMAASPGEVLARVNELLCADTLPSMFVTCFYALLDPISGKLHYANAGHDLPYRRSSEDVRELYATGMPLGLLPGMQYEEQEALVASTFSSIAMAWSRPIILTARCSVSPVSSN
jgi:serine phosphatase RsbU (regulator of sigma subunit)